MQRSNSILFLVLTTCIAIATQAMPTLARSKPIKSYVTVEGGRKLLLIMTCTRQYDSNVNIRSGAGKKYKVIRQVKDSTAIEVTREMQGDDSFTWKKVTYKGSIGWIRSDYLCDIPFT
jgi:uncharacterized protein YgiM (DUF1202 family)